jgi:hypothetical protein
MRDEISTRIADVTKTVTENYTETNQRVLDAVVENSRKAADFYVKTADQVSDQLPSIDLPFELPTPADAADRYVEFVERVVEMNREFSERIVKINRDYSDRVVEMLRDETVAPAPEATKPVAKKTTKRPAKKTATTSSKKASASK